MNEGEQTPFPVDRHEGDQLLAVLRRIRPKIVGNLGGHCLEGGEKLGEATLRKNVGWPYDFPSRVRRRLGQGARSRYTPLGVGKAGNFMGCMT